MPSQARPARLIEGIIPATAGLAPDVAGLIAHLEEMHQSPLEALRDYGVGSREYATAVILTLDIDNDGSPIHGVAFHHDDGPFRLRLIDQAIDACRWLGTH